LKITTWRFAARCSNQCTTVSLSNINLWLPDIQMVLEMAGDCYNPLYWCSPDHNKRNISLIYQLLTHTSPFISIPSPSSFSAVNDSVLCWNIVPEFLQYIQLSLFNNYCTDKCVCVCACMYYLFRRYNNLSLYNHGHLITSISQYRYSLVMVSL